MKRFKLIFSLVMCFVVSQATDEKPNCKICIWNSKKNHKIILNMYATTIIIFLDKMCVPHVIFEACRELVSVKSSEFSTITCIPARDR